MIRPGTQNILGVFAFNKALDVLDRLGEVERQRLAGLKHYFLDQLKVRKVSFIQYGAGSPCLVNTCNVAFGEKSGEMIATNLDLAGFAVGTGAACSTGSIDASHVLLAMGYSEKEALRGIRFSFGFATDKEAIDALISELEYVISDEA